MIVSSIVRRICLIGVLITLPLIGQSKSKPNIQLPTSMASRSAELDGMVRRVDALAKGQGFEGWPNEPWNDSYTPEPKVLKTLSPIIRKVWANGQVLWLYVPANNRWDAVLILKMKTPPRADSPSRLVLLKDAFGTPNLSLALSKDTWTNGNILSWENGPRHLHGQGFRLVQSMGDLQKLWQLSVQGRERRFACVLPDSDAGLSLAVHPEFGVGYQVDSVSDTDESELMSTSLKPAQFRQAKVVGRESSGIWFLAPVWPNDPQPFLCLATAQDFKSWSKK